MRSPRKMPRRPNSTPLPKGPSSPVSMPGGLAGSCLALKISMKPQKANICAQPAPDTLENAARPFHITEFQACGWRQVTWPTDILGHDVPQGGPHADAAVLDLSAATVVENIR